MSAAEDTASVVSTSSSSASSSQQSADPSALSKIILRAAAANSSANAKLRELLVLPKGFDPSDNDVIIGRGKRARSHGGNKRLRGLIAFMIPEYQAAGSNKDEKSYIIKEIVTQIRKSSPDGGFVKFDKGLDRWVEVGCFLAREKTSQTFRDNLGDTYSSSNPYKRKRRSFEKKHNAIVDIIKRRTSPPTSAAQQSGSSNQISPSRSPEPSTGKVQPLTQFASNPKAFATAATAPVLATPQNAFSRPGQIGFARRLSMQMGMPNGSFPGAAPQHHHLLQAAAPSPHHHHHHAAAIHHLRRMHSNSMSLAGGAVVSVHQPQPHFAAVATAPGHYTPHPPPACAGMPPLNTGAAGLSSYRRASSMPAPAFDPVLMNELMNRQRMARATAMLRHSSN